MESCTVTPGDDDKPVWRTVGKMSEGRSFLGSESVGGRVYQIAGCINEQFSTNEAWDPVTGLFQPVANCITKRDSQGQAAIDGEIFVAGGYDNISCKYLKTAEKYSPQKNAWSKLPSMSEARRSPGVVSHKNILYVVGGMGVGDDLSSVEMFNPYTSTWTSLGQDMNEVNGWCTACLGKPSMKSFEKTFKTTFWF